jgi:hypothetical protein
LEGLVVKNFVRAYVTNISVVLKIAALVAAVVLATSLAEFLMVPQIFEGPEWILWYWVTVPIPAVTTFTIYMVGGAAYALMGALDQISQTRK